MRMLTLAGVEFPVVLYCVQLQLVDKAKLPAANSDPMKGIEGGIETYTS